MLELQGKFGTAKVFTDVVDNESISQVINLLNQPYIEGSKVRMTPDIHAGAGCTIGTTMTIKDKICPNLVGVDIGCGMETIRIKETHIEPQKLDKVIRAGVPSGFEIRTEAHRYASSIDLSELYCAKMVNVDRAYKSIGTLGGGNHFIEANKDDDGHIYIVVHSGSRHLGLEIANFYQEAAFKALTSYSKGEIEEVVNELKAAGRQKEIQTVLKGMKAKKPGVPKQLAYVEGELFQTHAKYICHQVNCQARMGSGVAKQVRAKYPEVYNAYVGFCNEERNAFGQTQFVQANDGKVVVNMFAQSNYGYDGKLYTDYTAFQSCLKRIKLTVPAGETIAMPFKIGCGLGGGDWNVILGLIQKELSDKYTVELWRKEV